MCRVLGLRDSSYHQWRSRLSKNIEKKRKAEELIRKVSDIFEENHKIYGYRKMYAVLNKTGYSLSEYMVRRIMKENGLYPLIVTKYKPDKGGKSDGRFFDNILGREFHALAPNSVWAGDITYIKTKLGFVYCAAVEDLYNREIVGYSISKENTVT